MKEFKRIRDVQLWFVCFIVSASILLLMLIFRMNSIYLQIGFPPGGLSHHFLECLFMFST